ncbi:hypothetical protein LTR62_008098 [Meristemomyces frigidus]|uniref:FAD-binding domain-containing protein n=1 Tax=Meristemomyces frigidus TaxID=1508187 RepID=A0AAN7YM31_9PEZI|nr:hypothetical protein LTR62_008098 [Meristemomyces frigidus]
MTSQTVEALEIAIIGGGLCGLALAIALRKRSVPFKIYEGRSSFTELGAGINVGPNSSTALRLIDEDLATAFFAIANRNPPPKEDVYLDIRLGAPSGEFRDGEVIETLLAPPTGNTTIGRNALLQMLAEHAGLTSGSGQKDAIFNKKLSKFSKTSFGVTLTFEDGTTAIASAVIACDGIHSTVRRLLLGADSLVARPQYSESGAYRAILPFKELEAILGPERARSSQAIVGPGGYIIYYPTTATTMNVGFWKWRKGVWPKPEGWLLDKQGQRMQQDFAGWGGVAKQMVGMALEKGGGDEIQFWGTFYHAVQPEKCWEGRVCLLGDASHAMPPHAGAGAGQAMEDAYVLSEVLSVVNARKLHVSLQDQLAKAFDSYECVRRPRYQAVLEQSQASMHLWANLYDEPLTKEKVQIWRDQVRESFENIWHHHLEADAIKARKALEAMLESESI